MNLTDAPLITSEMGIQPDWIDYNGHLNMAYYSVLFDRSVDDAFELLGMGPNYAKKRRHTTYTAEFHICYLRELHLEHRVCGRFHLLDYDAKRLHIFQELYHIDGWLAATAETLTLHIDMSGPKAAPFPPDILERVETMYGTHKSLPRPERAGHSIGIKRRSA
ncbi:thioesterase family protein [Mesorhizobium sp. Z1-4]|uniref:thioesterase family protein n=1 Tax=Mesorhizobium sp. Z1-4 TaxID=2448478 RepID=UPI000FDB65C5|nr:thioesterase family protein [Mesorhizobium sp. Z1-4]